MCVVNGGMCHPLVDYFSLGKVGRYLMRGYLLGSEDL